MKPVKFPEQNKTYAENQKEYLPLPVCDNGEEVVSCWKLSVWERVKILFKGHLWLSEKMFGKPLTPVFLTVDKSDIFEEPL
jgi:hypothetical protein